MALGTRELTGLHRGRQLALRKVTIGQVEDLWPALDWTNLNRTYPGFAADVARLVSKNRRTSAGLAAAYLRAFRVASGLSGDVRIVVPPLNPEQLVTSLRVTSIVAAKRAATALVPAEVAIGNALSLTSGAMARLVLNGGRETVNQTILADEKALGWQRVLGGGGCDFCRMLAGRGAVYKETTVDFEAHDKCGCTSEPVYG